MTKRIAQTILLSDDNVAQGGVDVLAPTVDRTLRDIERGAREDGIEVDWRTVDLRIFRDVDVSTGQRDRFLTLRATALGEERPSTDG